MFESIAVDTINADIFQLYISISRFGMIIPHAKGFLAGSYPAFFIPKKSPTPFDAGPFSDCFA
jgi:hypothetical protein